MAKRHGCHLSDTNFGFGLMTKAKIDTLRFDYVDDTAARKKIFDYLVACGKENIEADTIENEFRWLVVEARNKLNRHRINGKLKGTLTVEYAQPRPVSITYHDTGEVDDIETIPQLALVGALTDGAGRRYVFNQCWVGRVFPQ